VVRQRVTPRNQAERERGGERKPGEEKHLERRHLEPADLLAPMAKPTPDQSHPSSSPRASPEPIRGATVNVSDGRVSEELQVTAVRASTLTFEKIRNSNSLNPIRLLPLSMNHSEHNQSVVAQQVEDSTRKTMRENSANMRLASH
jgi:hypothetical protein